MELARFLDLVFGQNYHVLGKHFAWLELLWLERYPSLPEILGDEDILCYTRNIWDSVRCFFFARDTWQRLIYFASPEILWERVTSFSLSEILGKEVNIFFVGNTLFCEKYLGKSECKWGLTGKKKACESYWLGTFS